MKTAAILIIGDEILSGKYSDENSPYLIRRLRDLGVRLRRIQVLPDEPETIATAIRDAVQEVDWVFTTGGIGPTHDDRTMSAVALAFGVPLISHPALVAVVEKAFPDGPTPAALRMALVPEGAELWWDGDVRFPLVVIQGVHILPGVPSITVRKFEAAAERWRGQPLFTAKLRTLEKEVDIAARLAQAQDRWSQVAIGSYPRLDDEPRHVVITVEGSLASQVEACRAWLREQLAPGPD
jgi:molybdenum cofactor synthesis domain-containing protein